MVDINERLVSTGEERNLLACVYQSEAAWLSVSDMITVEDFSHSTNKALWGVIDEMRNQNISPAPVLVHDKLPGDARKQLDEMGGWSYIEALGTLPVDPSNAEYHATKLNDLTVLRRGQRAGEKISFEATQSKSRDEFLTKVEDIVNEIPGPIGEEVLLLGSIAEEYVQNRAANQKEIPGLTSGYEKLDNAIQGFQPGRMYVIGARKKTGKSVLLLNMVKHLAVDMEIPVLYISTEQTQRDEVSRLIALASEVPESLINNGTFIGMKDYAEKVQYAVDIIKQAPIFFAHDPFFSLNKLRRTIKKHVIKNKIQAVFFDYIKIPSENIGSKDKWASVGDLAYGLKAVASDQNLPVITAVQINRDGAESFKFTGDIDSDAFANSDMIAQAMSVGMVLRPLNKDEQKDHQFSGEKRILKITDNRHGPANYKGLFAFHDDIIKLEERSRID